MASAVFVTIRSLQMHQSNLHFPYAASKAAASILALSYARSKKSP